MQLKGGYLLANKMETKNASLANQKVTKMQGKS